MSLLGQGPENLTPTIDGEPRTEASLDESAIPGASENVGELETASSFSYTEDSFRSWS